MMMTLQNVVPKTVLPLVCSQCDFVREAQCRRARIQPKFTSRSEPARL
jgi:hypothetical protein